MKMRYRGAEYDYNPPALAMEHSPLEGCYRGRTLQFSYVRHIPIPQRAASLTYRGVSYQVNSHGQTVPPVAAPIAAQPIKVQNQDAAQARQALVEDAARTHRQTLTRMLEHRLAVAQAQGNESLVQMLQAEKQYIVCS